MELVFHEGFTNEGAQLLEHVQRLCLLTADVPDDFLFEEVVFLAFWVSVNRLLVKVEIHTVTGLNTVHFLKLFFREV